MQYIALNPRRTYSVNFQFMASVAYIAFRYFKNTRIGNGGFFLALIQRILYFKTSGPAGNSARNIQNARYLAACSRTEQFQNGLVLSLIQTDRLFLFYNVSCNVGRNYFDRNRFAARLRKIEFFNPIAVSGHNFELAAFFSAHPF